MRETDLIQQMMKGFQRGPDQHNGLFECDAEIVTVGDQLWGMSMDDFSPAEDLFTSEDPERLGCNLVVATLSDLLAAGVTPKFFMQSICLPRTVDHEFIAGLMKGMRTTLDRAGCSLCGGDIGTAEPWRFCGFGMGPVAGNKPLTHTLAPEEQTLWITGSLGDANLAALQQTATPLFELRLREADLIRQHATACIDTSGGLFDALWLLHEQNRQLRFAIDLKKIPFAQGVPEAASRLGFAPESSLLGGAGEYELLFSIPADTEAEALSEIGATAIGTSSPRENPGIILYGRNGVTKTMEQPPPCPRAAMDIAEHLQDVMAMSLSLFGNV